MNCRQTRRGFTLTEVLVVIAILGILAGLLIPALQAAKNNAKNFHKNGWYMSTMRHDGRLWIMNRRMDYFLHHPDCPCKGALVKREEK